MSKNNSEIDIHAKKRFIRFKNKEVGRTPLLVPSFSSKTFDSLNAEFIEMEKRIESPILISAYDLHYKKLEIESVLKFNKTVFVDSGGYEALVDKRLIVKERYKSVITNRWDKKYYRSVIKNWVSGSKTPSVFVSYDHPDQSISFQKQVLNALSFFADFEVVKELLVKPEIKNKSIDVEKLLQNIKAFSRFEIIGFAEKDLGRTILERLTALYQIRSALFREGIEVPIHVFGSLDTVSTPLYFLCGADIFDGLSWYKYGFYEGNTIYKNTFEFLSNLTVTDLEEESKYTMMRNNLRYINDFQMDMRSYLNDNKMSSFRYHKALYQRYLNLVRAETKG